MDKNFKNFIASLGNDFLAEISDQVTREFSEKNGFKNGEVPINDFVTFTNYSSIRTNLILLEKYHEYMDTTRQ